MNGAENIASHLMPSGLRQKGATKVNPYTSGGARTVPATNSAKWSDFEKVVTVLGGAVTTLLGIILALVAVIYGTMTADISELKKDSKEVIRSIGQTRQDLTGSINAVEKQAIATNARLDQLIVDTRQNRR